MMISAFGPYIFISYGLRLDHIVIYLLLIYVVLCNEFVIKSNSVIITTIFLLIFIYVIPLLGLAFFDRSISNNLAISQNENYLQPFAVTIICFSILHKLSYEQIERGFFNTLRLFLVLMMLHSFLAFIINLYPEWMFWRNFTGANLIVTDDPLRLGRTASELARLGGRISGVFTQVFEAGYAYSVALISWAYLYNTFKKFIKYQNVILFVIIFGGILVNSKIFLVFGVCLFFVLLNNKKLLIMWSMIGLSTLLIIYLLNLNVSFFAETIKYVNRLILFNIDNVIPIYTGGRFSEESTIMIGINDVLNTSPYIGNGYGSIETSDFSLYEVIAIGGLLDLFFYLLLFVLFMYITLLIKNQQTKKYYICLIIITVFTSLAAPAITANRISLIFWIIFSFIVTMSSFTSKLKR